MKNRWLPYFTIFVFLSGCTTKKVVGNTFYSTSPKLEVEVSSELKYVGDKLYSQQGEEYHRGLNIISTQKFFIFESPHKAFAIAITKTPKNAQWLEPNFDGFKNRFDSGKQELGGRQYHYITYKDGPYIQRMYLKNVHASTTQIMMVYMEKHSIILSEEEDLKQFRKNCESAFTVK
jgi:hypothetical protein